MPMLPVGEWVDLRLRIAQAQAIIAYALKIRGPTVKELQHALQAVAHVLATSPIGDHRPRKATPRVLRMPPRRPSDAVMGLPYKPEKDAKDELSVREQEVLQRVSTGATNAQIAGSLFLSANSVKAHLQRIAKKLGTRTRGQAVAEGYRKGLLRHPIDPPPDDPP